MIPVDYEGLTIVVTFEDKFLFPFANMDFSSLSIGDPCITPVIAVVKIID
jgi:hypothetical protein